MKLLVSEDASPEAEAPDPAEQEDFDPEEDPVEDAATDDDPAPEDDAEDEEGPEEPQLITVKVDGKEQRVTLEDLTRDYSGRKSIERRIGEVEGQRKEAEAIFGALQGEYRQIQGFVQKLQTEGLKPAPTPPPPALAETNPAAYVKALAKFNADAGLYRQQQHELQAVQARQSQISQAAQEAYLAEQFRALAEHLPDFAKPETAKAAQERLVRAADHYGYTAEEVGSVMDARAVRVLHDAAQWQALKARKAEVATKQPTQAPRHVPVAAARRPEPAQLAHARQVKQAIAKGPLSAAQAAELLLIPQSPRR